MTRKETDQKREIASLKSDKRGLLARLGWCQGMVKRLLTGWFKPARTLQKEIDKRR